MHVSNTVRAAAFVAAFAITGIFFECTGFAKGLTYNGRYNADENRNGSIEQQYLQNVGLSLDHRLSDILSMREYVRYTSNWDESTDTDQESMAQGVSLTADYELFRTEVSAYSDLGLSGYDQKYDAQRYELRWASKWQNDLVPGMHLMLNNQQQDSDDQTLAQGAETNGVVASLDWMRNSLSMGYNYRFKEDKPNGGDFVSTRTSNDFLVGYSSSFWQDRVRLQVTENYRTSSNEQEARRTGAVSLAVNISEVRTGTDNTPADSFEDPLVVLNSLMNDGDFSVNAFTVVTNSASNIIAIALNGNNIDHLYLYTATDIGAAAAGTLTWSAYSNDILGTSWNALPIGAVIYNSNMRRFEIDLGDIAVEYLKLALDIPLLGPIINFTEIQAVDGVFLTSHAVLFSDFDSSITGVNIAAKASENITLSYRAGLTKNETRGSRGAATESEELNQSAGINYDSMDRTFSTSLTFNIRTKETQLSEEETNSFSLDLNKDFFPTLSTSAGISRAEISQGSTPLSESTTFRFEGIAKIYPDLDLNIQINSSEAKNLPLSRKSSSDSIYTSLVSRLSPSITMVFRENYDDSETSQSYRTVLSFNWQVSELLVVSGSLTNLAITGDIERDLNSYSTNINLALSNDALLKLEYTSSDESGITTESGDASLNWRPDNWVKFEIGCLYQRAPSIVDNFYRAYGRVDVNFAVP